METKQTEGTGSATIYDVAREAGVSAMTVSRVVNGSASVSEKTKAKVLEVVEKLNYQVNVAARAARVGTLRVALLHSGSSPAFLSSFLVGAMGQCNLHGAQLVLEQCDDLRTQRKAIDKLVADGIDGILLPTPLCDSKPAVKHLAQIGMPVVAVATARPAPEMSAVRIDDYEGAAAMTRHLLELGHTDIAFIKGDPEHTPSQLRYQAFLDTMRDAGHSVPADRIAQGMYTYRSGLLAARELLAQATRPTAIFASNDDMAAATIAVAHGMQLQLPDELAICGFDDTPVATSVWPQLTTVHQPITEMAREAVTLLLEHIRARRAGNTFKPQHRELPFTVVARESTQSVF